MSIGKSIFELSKSIGYTFRNIVLLENALTHSSYANEQRARGISYPSNERLEFFGDAVLQLLISEHLYETLVGKSEGVLTKMRQHLVCEKTLSRIAASINLGEYLNVGHGEELTDCRRRPKVLADALEALIAAIYLDSDSFAVKGSKEVILDLFADEINNCKMTNNGDYKTTLQQLVEKDGSATLAYEVVAEKGPEHEKTFTVVVKVNNNVVGEGTATTKKDAEQQAARIALALFGITI